MLEVYHKNGLPSHPYCVGDTGIFIPPPPKIARHPPRTKITKLTCARCGRYYLLEYMSREAILGIHSWKAFCPAPSIAGVYLSASRTAFLRSRSKSTAFATSDPRSPDIMPLHKKCEQQHMTTFCKACYCVI